MKTMKYSLKAIVIALSLLFTACYEDKGSYQYEDWSDIVSVEGVQIKGSASGKVTILEGDSLIIRPKITFKEGVNANDFDYYWVLGGDTIGREADLEWEISPVNIRFYDKEAYFWLEISNKDTGEKWKHYAYDSGSTNTMVKVKIQITAYPQIGAIIYEKQNDLIEWASIKGANKNIPGDFEEIYLDMYSRYNPTKSIQGKFIGASFDSKQLIIYTQTAPSYGAFIQTATDKTYPFGFHMNTVRDSIYLSEPTGTIHSKKYYWGAASFQETLINDKLYIGSVEADNYPYQMIDPNWAPTEGEVAQTMGAIPFNNYVVAVNVMRKNNGEIYYYNHSPKIGNVKRGLLDENATALKLDKIVGVFREPTDNEEEYIFNTRFYVIGKTGASYKLYVYRYEQLSNLNLEIYFDKVVDVTAWGGAMSSEAIWFTSNYPVTSGNNYAFFTKGDELWRFSYEALANPEMVKKFDSAIVSVTPTIKVPNDDFDPGQDDLYTMLFTYNQSTDKSSLYALDVSQPTIKEHSVLKESIPGKVVAYMPVYW